MWCLWALPLLGLAVRVASEGTSTVSCNETSLDVQPPLYVKIFTDEAHFVCSSGFKLQGQNILTCINTNWDHPVPTCEKLPTKMIKMKCPFDHREWTLSNLNMISSWLEHNPDQEIILDSDYIEDTPESRRLAAEMLARFKDPFFRFYANLATVDKSLPMKRLITRFQGSPQFLQLRNRMRDELTEFDFNDIDEDENVLLRYYGLHFVDVMKDIILPYDEAITKPPQTEKVSVPNHGETLPDLPWRDIRPFDGLSEDIEVNLPPVEQVSTIQPELTSQSNDALSMEFSSSELANVDDAPSGESTKRNVRRDKGDIEKLLPPWQEGKDLFDRKVTQQLTGLKAAEQRRIHKESYIDHLKAIVKHIIKYNIPKHKWPEYLQKYDLEEISIILEIPNPDTPDTVECQPPWNLGFDLVSNGAAMLQGKTVVISCNPGYYLRGAKVLYCVRGRWDPRGAGMPTCISVSREPTCDGPVPSLQDGRIIKADMNFVVYECLPGYTMRGSRMLSCRNGQWVPTDGNAMPVCLETREQRSCGRPPAPFNGGTTEPHMMTDGRRLVVRYYCNANYSMSGEDYSMCVDGQWTPYNFRCTLSGQDNVPDNTELPQTPKICRKLVVPNASVKYYEDGRSSVRVTCLPGYRMIGSSHIRCENGLYIDQIPSCEDRGAFDTCTPPSAPTHGSVLSITQTSVRFSCDRGYTLIGKDRSNCYLGRWDNPTPVCISGSSGSGCNNTDQIQNRNLFGYVYSNGRWLECAERVEMRGGNHQFCRDGRWDDEPVCMTTSNKTSVLYPESIDCPLPEVPPSSGIKISSRGVKIYYRCEFRDAELRGDRVNECVRGRWINPVPYCERRGIFIPPTPTPTVAPQRGCSPRPIRGGQAYIYSEGRVVIYQCLINYIIRGQTTLSCERSQWSHPLPSCYNAVGVVQEDGEIFYDGQHCPPPPTYPGTTSFLIMNGGLRIVYYCPGGNTTIQNCINGRWQGSPPPCSSAGVCEPQEIENGKFFQYRRGSGYVQCKGGFVLESDLESRGEDVTCDSDTGRWSFGLDPPRCVPDLGKVQDDRPFDAIDDTPYGNRLQIDDCGPPEIASEFSFYIQRDGRSVALGCKRPRRKRSTGSIECTNGTWEFSTADICSSDCGLHDVKIANGVKVLYDQNEYVFQCFQKYELIGPPIAYCPGYIPNSQYNTSLVQQFGPDFRAPECRRTDTELRPISGGDVLDSDAFQSCRWLAEFGKHNLTPKDYYISDHGKVVTWRNHEDREGKESLKTAECLNGMWVHKAIQTRGCDSLPNEPEQGTFFLYEDSRGQTSIYFQCLEGYRLYGSRVAVCSTSRVRVPDCYLEVGGGTRGAYRKVKNPNPLSVNRCPTPPEYLPNAEVTLHQSGDMFAINCAPGFVIADTRNRYAIVRCNQFTWSPEILSRCVRDGDRTPLPTREPPARDLFGRELPQRLTGDKAERQDAQLREQFRQHAQQLVEFAKARNRELRQSGFPPNQKPIELPIISTIPDDERKELFRRNEDFYQEIENLLANIREERIRRRRQNELTHVDPSSEIIIPIDLLHLEESIRKNNLTQPDIDIMRLLSETDRLKFLEEKKSQQEKSRSDPVQSQNFVRKAMAEKSNSAKKKSAEDNRSKSSNADNSIENSSSAHQTLSSSTEGMSSPVTETTTETTTESTTETLSTTTVSTTSNAPDEVTSLAPQVLEESTTEADDMVSTQTNELEDSSAANNSSGVRKGYDDSCSEKFATAPKIENGFLVSYEVLDGPEGKVLQANYRCFEDFSFEYEHTSTVRCRNGQWIGELPTCIPDEDSEEEEDSDGAYSQINKLK